MTKTQQRQIESSIIYVIANSGLESKQSKRDYHGILRLCVTELDNKGYRLRKLNGLKQKHIVALVDHWQTTGKNVRTIKNRLSVLTLACETLKKRGVVYHYDHYAPQKTAVAIKAAPKNKAIDSIDLEKIKDPYIKASVSLQQAFGLRREECLKIMPAKSAQGDELHLQASWTKGGIERKIPIVTKEQRQALDNAIALVGNGSMVPRGKNYIQQRGLYDTVTQACGMKNLHGLRHAYAQQCYAALTAQYNDGNGWLAPLAGGPSTKQLSAEMREIDRKVRFEISSQLGHGREYVTKIYLG